ncbi:MULTISPECIES: ABC transporter permease [Desulfococcus]|jgi:microcin C transport system permease protein|uniref:ABC-type transporter, integral membrane subunit n=1 Tax=Desulfococcus multivorans DSM 2059 TaxID=1121405 RepID=S7T9I0_DESML|nr:ABC transporter permease subunit [Desulfococcus multivorans]AOY59725.1 putative ABC transporter, permease protein [Desulfococcus multivorans]AQV01899.1 peptide ABC transporter permease [Desulfococcus multivorans]EPR33210.1 ABC-type transporter, integral membrane subunit [Desulfococcus multivorans DSM 2059]MDX9817702.1 ABC transporter permease subunit [Desulfococcus multivorans]SKA23772.1 microcin C transport system permease protein [Desulfococcus multivorans DSM 2059]
MRRNPLTLKKIRRFKSIRRGYVSFIIFCLMMGLSLTAELFINSRALVVHYEGRYYFPTYGRILPGTTFGLDYDYETNYRELKARFDAAGEGNWVLMPPAPYNPYENDLRDDAFPPFPPSIASRHFLGTDIVGRDLLARLVYGFRIAIFFSLGLLLANYAIGVSIGCAMGYFGGRFDLFFQRIIEIWSNVPFLYVIIIISSVVVPNFFILILIMAFFGWIGMTWTMRTVTYKEKEREYVLAAQALGASNLRIIFRHIIPNTVAVIVTYAPFSVSGGIVSLTSLDYLGFGLPPPTPSWGELLQQGWTAMDAWWIAGSVIAAMVVTLVTVTFIGEAVREAFDPRLHTVYE